MSKVLRRETLIDVAVRRETHLRKLLPARDAKQNRIATLQVQVDPPYRGGQHRQMKGRVEISIMVEPDQWSRLHAIDEIEIARGQQFPV